MNGHLDEKFIMRQKKRLLKEKARLEAELAKIAERNEKGYKPRWSDIGTDEDENASESEIFASTASLEGNLEALLKNVEAALARIEAGTYGLDVTDGSPIPKERLEAFPAATLTVENEKKLEASKLRRFKK
jgi:DnaK suppressor protein